MLLQLSRLEQFQQQQPATTLQRRRSRNEDRLRPFTDYSAKPYRRPPFNRSITVPYPPSSAASSDVTPQFAFKSNLFRGAGGGYKSDEQSSSDHSSLLERRKRKNLKLSRRESSRTGATNRTEYSPLDERHELVPPPPEVPPPPKAFSDRVSDRPRVTFSADSVIPSIDIETPSSSHDMSLPIQIPFSRGADVRSTNSSSVGAKRAFTSHATKFADHVNDDAVPADLCTNHSGDYTKQWVEQSLQLMNDVDAAPAANAAVKAAPLAAPSFGAASNAAAAVVSVAPVHSIITPTRVEYTTITDDIDTSCLNYRSPGGSPTTPKPPGGFGFNMDVARYTKKELPLRSYSESVENEARRLKRAEEEEHEEMEVALRRRMRQISLTEHDSFGDIATLFIQDVVPSSSESSVNEPTSYSDDEKTRERLTVARPERIRHVSSEPSLKISTSPTTSEYSMKTPQLSPTAVDTVSDATPVATTVMADGSTIVGTLMDEFYPSC